MVITLKRLRLLRETRFSRSPFQEFTDLLAKPTTKLALHPNSLAGIITNTRVSRSGGADPDGNQPGDVYVLIKASIGGFARWSSTKRAVTGKKHIRAVRRDLWNFKRSMMLQSRLNGVFYGGWLVAVPLR
ncbi:hypothetical protein E3N88_24220 [Mikania micrantha]|uniref:Uncharacterized protein n=1 Tax=Mikania micrantha TaxID=192012 RepID=A0A5N6NGM0_9ASTR|nr:hypothetical protein E3N88_24220 [Mikania micrantha]